MSKRQSRDHIEPTGDLFAPALTADTGGKLPPTSAEVIRRLIRWAQEAEEAATEVVEQEEALAVQR